MILIVNCQSCGKQLFRDQDYEPKGDGVQILVPPCECTAQHRAQRTACAMCGGEDLHNEGCAYQGFVAKVAAANT